MIDVDKFLLLQKKKEDTLFFTLIKTSLLITCVAYKKK